MTGWASAALRNCGHMPAKHHRLLIKELEALSNGESYRLLIEMPPGSAKSSYTSILLPAWWLARHPCDSIIAASHTARLANHFGRRARGIVADEAGLLGYELGMHERAGSHWSSSTGAEYFAIGVRGAVVGKRADIAIIDDPIKSQVDAESLLHRERLWDWYRSELYPRLKPKARVVLIMTRWHQDDLCGRLLAHASDPWRCLRLPAFAEVEDRLDRLPGEPLWPEWEDTEELLRRRSSVGEHTWSAQYQQSPCRNTGTLFKVTQLDFVDTLPTSESHKAVRAWDLAATVESNNNDPDWTVGVKLTRDHTGRLIVADVVRVRCRPCDVEAAVAATARIDGPSVPIALPEDPGQAGKSQVSYYARQLAGYNVQSTKETGSKVIRAMPIASQVSKGNVVLLRANWNYSFIEELRDFPYGRKDDQVDALSRAFMMLASFTTSARSESVPYMPR